MTSVQTTDGKFLHVLDGEWWQTDGIDLVDQEVVDAHMRDNPAVGLMVTVGEE